MYWLSLFVTIVIVCTAVSGVDSTQCTDCLNRLQSVAARSWSMQLGLIVGLNCHVMKYCS